MIGVATDAHYIHTHVRPRRLSGIGQVATLDASVKRATFFFKFVTFTTPGDVYCGDALAGRVALHRRLVVRGLDASQARVEQHFATSKDGTQVPYFVVRRVPADAAPTPTPAPALVYGYGGFNISLLPTFSIKNLLFVLNFGGVFVQANLRGGGELGRAWHQAGVKSRKQNVFDDCAAVLDDVVARGLTTPRQLVLEGGSNGGLLVCAMATQYAAKFACGLSHVPVTDMLKFQRHTIGYAWTSDYGSADASKEEFDALRAYSPLHNVRASTAPWPALLVLTADHDDRVVPLHSFKFIATVQVRHSRWR